MPLLGVRADIKLTPGALSLIATTLQQIFWRRARQRGILTAGSTVPTLLNGSRPELLHGLGSDHEALAPRPVTELQRELAKLRPLAELQLSVGPYFTYLSV